MFSTKTTGHQFRLNVTRVSILEEKSIKHMTTSFFHELSVFLKKIMNL